jgi:hypothetical protein
MPLTDEAKGDTRLARGAGTLSTYDDDTDPLGRSRALSGCAGRVAIQHVRWRFAIPLPLKCEAWVVNYAVQERR